MVNKTKNMGKLMHKRTDAYWLEQRPGSIADLITGGISVDIDTVELWHFLVPILVDFPSMRPDGIALSTVGLSEPGIEEVDVIDHPITVEVILREIHLIVEHQAGINDHLIGQCVQHLLAVATIVALWM